MNTTHTNDVTGDAAPENQSAPPGGTMRIDTLGSAGLESIPDAPSKRKIPTQVVLLVVLLVISGGALYAMRRMGMGPIGAAADVPLDYDYTKKAVGDEHKKAIEDLNANHIASQVPSDDVQKNPFKLAESLKREIPLETKTMGPDPAAARAELIRNTLSSLRVHGILDGSVPVARINDQTVKVGDALADVFVVTAIQGRTIELTADEKTYTLSLDEEQAPGAHRPPTPPKAPAPKRK
jgi:Tfp pilus assembly protein PilP